MLLDKLKRKKMYICVSDFEPHRGAMFSGYRLQLSVVKDLLGNTNSKAMERVVSSSPIIDSKPIIMDKLYIIETTGSKYIYFVKSAFNEVDDDFCFSFVNKNFRGGAGRAYIASFTTDVKTDVENLEFEKFNVPKPDFYENFEGLSLYYYENDDANGILANIRVWPIFKRSYLI